MLHICIELFPQIVNCNFIFMSYIQCRLLEEDFSASTYLHKLLLQSHFVLIEQYNLVCVLLHIYVNLLSIKL